jgi:manganese transport protein
MITLIIFTGRRDIMGGFVNGKVVRAAALLGAGVVLALNMVLIAQAIGLQIPGLSAAG